MKAKMMSTMHREGSLCPQRISTKFTCSPSSLNSINAEASRVPHLREPTLRMTKLPTETVPHTAQQPLSSRRSWPRREWRAGHRYLEEQVFMDPSFRARNSATGTYCLGPCRKPFHIPQHSDVPSRRRSTAEIPRQQNTQKRSCALFISPLPAEPYRQPCKMVGRAMLVTVVIHAFTTQN